ncbi:MAG: outer membrane beta-barrel protein, partial [Erythrobacter sp.]|nr:outer membrane beta-barrel protein [Erythrobacter sp.]
MKKLLLSASLVALAIPATAQAQAYIGVSGGLATNEDATNSGVFTDTLPAIGSIPAITAGTPYEFETNVDVGWTAGAQLGYAFDNGLRVELDGNYQSMDIEYHRGLITGGVARDGDDFGRNILRGNPTGTDIGTWLASATGDVETYGLFANVLYDFNRGGNINPYLGVGAGLFVVDADYAPGGYLISDRADTTWAWQGIAGISGRLSHNVELFAEYKYRDMLDDATLENQLLPATLSTEFTQHTGVLGLRFFLGGEELPPPPPPP